MLSNFALLLQLALDQELGYDDDVLVVAGDTLFPGSFSLADFVSRFDGLKLESPDEGASLIVETACSEEEVQKRGIIEWDRCGRIKLHL